MRPVFHAIAVSLLVATAAHAEDAARHAMRAPVACVVADSARLATGKGVALVSHGGSFSQMRDGGELFAGDRILIRSGAANLSAGGRLLARAGAGSLLTLDSRDGKLCVAQASSDPAAIAAGSRNSSKDCDREENKRDLEKCPPLPIGEGTAEAGAGGPFLSGSALPVVGAIVVGGAVAGGLAAGSGGSDDNQKLAALIYLSNLSPQ
jgi:hypothetical protein